MKAAKWQRGLRTESRRLFGNSLAQPRNFAVGVFNLAHCFSPQVIVIGGGMSRAGELLLGPMRAHLKRCERGCPASRAKVIQAEGGDDVGLLGGLAYWMDCSEKADQSVVARKG